MDLSERDFGGHPGAIFAPAVNDETLDQRVAGLRDHGEIVVCELPGRLAGLLIAVVTGGWSGRGDWVVKPL
jgi:hypothetical protein